MKSEGGSGGGWEGSLAFKSLVWRIYLRNLLPQKKLKSDPNSPVLALVDREQLTVVQFDLFPSWGLGGGGGHLYAQLNKMAFLSCAAEKDWRPDKPMQAERLPGLGAPQDSSQ